MNNPYLKKTLTDKINRFQYFGTEYGFWFGRSIISNTIHNQTNLDELYLEYHNRFVMAIDPRTTSNGIYNFDIEATQMYINIFLEI